VRCAKDFTELEEEGEAEAEAEELDVVLCGRNVGSDMDGGSDIVGRNEAVSVGSVTVTRIDPMSSWEPPSPGIKVIVKVVRSDSTRLMIATSPAAELTSRETEVVGEETVKLAVAFETAEVDMYRADARNAMNICGTMFAPSGSGPSVETVAMPPISVAFQPPRQSGSSNGTVGLQRNGVYTISEDVFGMETLTEPSARVPGRDEIQRRR